MNLKGLKKDPIFFEVCGIDYLKQIKSSHIIEKY
jgi:hypothetical protein